LYRKKPNSQPMVQSTTFQDLGSGYRGLIRSLSPSSSSPLLSTRGDRWRRNPPRGRNPSSASPSIPSLLSRDSVPGEADDLGRHSSPLLQEYRRRLFRREAHRPSGFRRTKAFPQVVCGVPRPDPLIWEGEAMEKAIQAW
jgi:hypothetical protein